MRQSAPLAEAALRACAALALLLLAIMTGATPAHAASATAPPQQFAAASARVQVARSDGSRFPALLFYPAVSPFAGSALDRRAAPYPAIAFGHGFLSNPVRYAETFAHLARRGYIVIASESGLELFPNHQRFADDLRASLDFLEQAEADPGSLLYGGVNSERFGVAGHSMGGGTSVLAAAADPRIDAIATLAAAETRPSAIAATTGLTVPALFIAAGDDIILLPKGGPDEMFAAAPAPKLLVTINGGTHCGFLSGPLVLALCGSGGLDAPTQRRLTQALLNNFFDLYLKGDESVRPAVWQPDLLFPGALVVEADRGREGDMAEGDF